MRSHGDVWSLLPIIFIYCLIFPPYHFLPCLPSHSRPSISLQTCELHVAGYRFSVLSSAFVVHRGFKIQGEFHARKDEENKRNRVLFRSFKEGLKTKYPSSNRRCWNKFRTIYILPPSVFNEISRMFFLNLNRFRLLSGSLHPKRPSFCSNSCDNGTVGVTFNPTLVFISCPSENKPQGNVATGFLRPSH